MRTKVKKRSIHALLDEGILDTLIRELEKYQEQEAAAWLRAVQQGGRKEKILPPKFKKDGSPETKISAAAVTAIVLGNAVKVVNESEGEIDAELGKVQASGGEGEDFIKETAQFYKAVTDNLSAAVGWLQHPDLEEASKKFAKISDNLEGETIADSLSKMGAAFKEIDSMGIEAEIDRLFADPVAQKTLEKDKEADGKLSDLVDTANDMLLYLNRASEASAYLLDLSKKMKEIDQLIDEKSKSADSPGELESSMFEGVVRKFVRGVIEKEAR